MSRDPTVATKPQDRLRFGLVGCGRVARLRYLPIFQNFGSGRLTAVADKDPSRLEEVRRQFPKVRAFTDHQHLLAEGEVDALIIAIPPYLHAQAALDAIEAGIHVLVEKPFTTTLADAERVVAAAQASPVKVMVGFNRRRLPPLQQMRQLIEKGAIGRPYGGEFVHISPITGRLGSRTGFEADRRLGGGALLDSCCHDLDLVRFLFGSEVTSVRCLMESRRSDDDSAWLLLTLAGGAIVSIYCGFCNFGVVGEERLLILGEEGHLRCRSSFSSVEFAPRRLGDHWWEPWRNLADYARAALWMLSKKRHWKTLSIARQLESFILGIQQDLDPSPGVLDGLENVRIIEAAYRSAALGGAPVLLEGH